MVAHPDEVMIFLLCGFHVTNTHSYKGSNLLDYRFSCDLSASQFDVVPLARSNRSL
jgi:hypothetical protein